MSPVVVSNQSGPNRSGIDGLIKAGLNPQQQKRADLQQKLVGDISNILSTEIQFIPAATPYENTTAALKAKYIQISAAKKVSAGGFDKGEKNGDRLSAGSSLVDRSAAQQDEIPLPKVDIFPSTRVKLAWLKRYPIGSGLRNQGNTCFLNSIMQSLTYTSPLVNYLIGDHSRERCIQGQSGFCSLCELRGHISRALINRNTNDSAISPSICTKIKAVMKSYQYGRQEDAHEFLRYLIDSMQNSCLSPYKNQKLDMWSKQTTPISRIFGGYHKNEIICLLCQSKSITFDPFLDLSLEIKGETVEKCLQHFTRVETLQNENAYQCGKCKRKTSARKCYSVHRPPNILTLQIKRFSHFGKVGKAVEFPEKLNLRPFMSVKEGPPVMYNLYAVVVHVGGSMNSGHYFSFVKSTEGSSWHVMDDSRVSPVGLKTVLNTQAYLLFYSKVELSNSAGNSPNARQVAPPNIIKGVILNSDERHIGASINGSSPTKSPLKPTFSPLTISRPMTNGVKSNIKIVSVTTTSARPSEVIKVKISPKSTVSAAKLVGLAPKLVPYEEEDEEEHMVESNKSNGVREEFPLKKSADTTGGWESIPLTKEIKIAQPTNFIPPILLKKQQIKVVAKRSEKFDNTVENEVIKDEKKEEKPDSTSFVKPIDGEKPRNRTYRERKWSSGDSSISSNDKERKSRKKERRSRSPVASDKHIDHDYHQRHKSISSHRHPSSTTDESDSRRSDKKRKFTPSDESDGSSDGRHHHRKKEKRRKREEDEERREVKEKDKKKKKKKKRREEKERRERSRSPSRASHHSSSSTSSSVRKATDEPKWNTSSNPDAMVVERKDSIKSEKKIDSGPISISHNRFSVLDELKKGSCNAGLGPSVKSWNGAESKVESLGRNRDDTSDKSEPEDYQEEERSHHKKKKHQRHAGSGSSNLFQKLQDEKRYGVKNWD